jgi:hypothetical protein
VPEFKVVNRASEARFRHPQAGSISQLWFDPKDDYGVRVFASREGEIAEAHVAAPAVRGIPATLLPDGSGAVPDGSWLPVAVGSGAYERVRPGWYKIEAVYLSAGQSIPAWCRATSEPFFAQDNDDLLFADEQ